MAKFITSIELFNANETDYLNLSKALESERFKKNNQRHQHQKGVEYNVEGNITLTDVTDKVFKVARGIGKKYAFTIIKEKQIQDSLYLKKAS